jgi:hypothetical protein
MTTQAHFREIIGLLAILTTFVHKRAVMLPPMRLLVSGGSAKKQIAGPCSAISKHPCLPSGIDILWLMVPSREHSPQKVKLSQLGFPATTNITVG